MANVETAREIFYKHNIDLNERWLSLVKCGHNETQKLRLTLADFFGVGEKNTEKGKMERTKGITEI